MLSFFIFTFLNSNEVIRAEIELKDIQGIRVVPLFPQISSGCGLCLRIPKDELNRAKNILDDKNIKVSGIYFRDEEKRITKL